MKKTWIVREIENRNERIFAVGNIVYQDTSPCEHYLITNEGSMVVIHNFNEVDRVGLILRLKNFNENEYSVYHGTITMEN